jgi:uncharacterized spore protein YtfJ
MAGEPQELLKLITDRLESIASVKTIVGDPVTVADSTIIPVCRIMVGFGGGGGSGEGIAESKGKGGGGGAAGGGGVRVDPVAFIVIRGEEVSLLTAKPGRLEAVFDSFPKIVEKIQEMKSAKKEKAEEEKKEK